MKTIKTRHTVKNVKVLDKSISASKHMKDAFIRTKNKAEETQNSSHATPTDYASDNIQITARGAAEETVHHLPTPRRVNSVRHKVSDNWNRAKGHFQEVKRQMPKERQHIAEQTQKTAQTTKTNAIKLRSEADHAFNQAREARAAVKDAKLALKQVKQSGRQTIREVKLDVKQNMKIMRGAQSGINQSERGYSPAPVSQKLPVGATDHSTSGTANPLTKDSKLPRRRVNAIKTRNSVPQASNSISAPTGNTLKSEVSRSASEVISSLPKNGKLPDQPIKAVKTQNSIKPINKPSNTSKINVGHSISGASGNTGRRVTPVAELSNKSFESQGKLRLSDLNPFRRKTTPPKVTDVKTTAPVNKTTVTPGKPIKDGILRPSYTNAAPRRADKAAQTLQKSAEAVKSTKKSIKDTAKSMVKTAKKSVRTAEKTAKKVVKTAQQTAKTAQKTAKASAKTAKTAERAARATAKTAVKTAKIATKAIAAVVKASIAAIKGLASAIIASGWIAVLVILIICMIALLVGSIFGIFFSGEPNEGGKTINMVIAEINAEYTAEIDGITDANAYDLIDMSGARAAWKQVLAVYTVKTVSDPDNPMEVATVNDEKATILKTIFWDMNTIAYTVDSVDVEEDVLDDDGLPTGETTTITKTVLRIIVTHKTHDEMAQQYGFTDEQKEWLEELLKPEYHSLWNSLLYGISTIGDGTMIEIADTQIGNVGGEPYWSWYGFTSRVEWCACFVSWVAEQCGYIDAGIMPRFSGCMFGVQWFKDREQWQDNTYTPRPGDIIFFDWEPDGTSDHVGIVESVIDGRVNTIEGNSGDVCRRQSYDLGSVKIYGYGTPLFP